MTSLLFLAVQVIVLSFWRHHIAGYCDRCHYYILSVSVPTKHCIRRSVRLTLYLTLVLNLTLTIRCGVSLDRPYVHLSHSCYVKAVVW